MDFTIFGVEAGTKYKAFLDYIDNLYGTTRSRSIFFETPEAPPNIALSQFAPLVSKEIQTVTETQTTSYTVKKVYRSDAGRVKITLNQVHNLRAKQKVEIRLTSYGSNNVADFNGVVFVSSVPNNKQFRYYSKRGAKPWGTATGSAAGTVSRTADVVRVSKTIATSKIPVGVENSLMWTKTVRDVVYFIYRTANKRSLLKKQAFKYMDTNSLDTDTLFSTTPPSYPTGLTKKIRSLSSEIATSIYEIRYVIVRYEDQTGLWTNSQNIKGYFPMVTTAATITVTDGYPSVSSIADIIISAPGVIQ